MLGTEAERTIDLIHKYCVVLSKQYELTKEEQDLLKEEFNKIKEMAAAERGIKLRS